MDDVPLLAILLIALPIGAGQDDHLHARGDDDQQTGAARDPHALAVVGPVTLGEDVRSQDGTTLAAGGEDGQGGGALRVGGVGVADPGEGHGDADEDEHGEEEAKVAWADARRGAQDDVADGGEERRDRDKGAPVADPVGQERRPVDRQEAEHVRRRREPVALDRAERPHFADDRRHEERQRREAHVAAKVHQRREVGCVG